MTVRCRADGLPGLRIRLEPLGWPPRERSRFFRRRQDAIACTERHLPTSNPTTPTGRGPGRTASDGRGGTSPEILYTTPLAQVDNRPTGVLRWAHNPKTALDWRPVLLASSHPDGVGARRKTRPTGGVYSGTKFAVNAISEALRQELLEDGIRITMVEPGAVATELTDHITDEEVREGLKQRSIEPLQPEDIANAIAYAVGQPQRVSVNEILIRPTQQTN